MGLCSSEVGQIGLMAVTYIMTNIPELQETFKTIKKKQKTRSSWLNCVLRDDEAVYWVSTGHYEAVAVGSSWLTDSFTHRL